MIEQRNRETKNGIRNQTLISYSVSYLGMGAIHAFDFVETIQDPA